MLNQRLLEITQFVTAEDCIIDVGCDHALLDIYLIKHGLVREAIASDYKKGPLEQAKKNIRKYHLEDRIKVQLSDGIQTLDTNTNTIIISGMGGCLMVGICKYLPLQMRQIRTIILSPNSDLETVRREFVKMGYFIDFESLVEERGIIYPVVRFQKGRGHYTYVDYLLGPFLRKHQNTLFHTWNKREIKQKELLLSLLPKKYWWRRLFIRRELYFRKLYEKH